MEKTHIDTEMITLRLQVHRSNAPKIKEYAQAIEAGDDRSFALGRKQLFSKIPNHNAGIEEWREWALESRKWAFAMSSGEKKRRGQLVKLRKELRIKNATFKRYKEQIADLESRITEYEKSIIFRIGTFVKCMIARG